MQPDKSGLPHQAVDSSHAVYRSTTGWITMMAGAAVMWAVRSQLQPSLSSAEAELYGLSTAVCDVLAFLNVLEKWRSGTRALFPFWWIAERRDSSRKIAPRLHARATYIVDGSLSSITSMRRWCELWQCVVPTTVQTSSQRQLVAYRSSRTGPTLWAFVNRQFNLDICLHSYVGDSPSIYFLEVTTCNASFSMTSHL